VQLLAQSASVAHDWLLAHPLNDAQHDALRHEVHASSSAAAPQAAVPPELVPPDEVPPEVVPEEPLDPAPEEPPLFKPPKSPPPWPEEPLDPVPVLELLQPVAAASTVAATIQTILPFESSIETPAREIAHRGPYGPRGPTCVHAIFEAADVEDPPQRK
jgi:hypothetical protein